MKKLILLIFTSLLLNPGFAHADYTDSEMIQSCGNELSHKTSSSPIAGWLPIGFKGRFCTTLADGTVAICGASPEPYDQRSFHVNLMTRESNLEAKRLGFGYTTCKGEARLANRPTRVGNADAVVRAWQEARSRRFFPRFPIGSSGY